MSSCRTCHAEIEWVRTPEGRTMPIDPEPAEDGNLALIAGDPIIAVPVAANELLVDDDGLRYKSHFATCPQADQHRRRTS